LKLVVPVDEDAEASLAPVVNEENPFPFEDWLHVVAMEVAVSIVLGPVVVPG